MVCAIFQVKVLYESWKIYNFSLLVIKFSHELKLLLLSIVDNFGALLAFATDLLNICLQCVVGFARCGCSSWNKKLLEGRVMI